MSKHDTTFDEISLYGSERWVARTLGRSVEWMRARRDEFATAGFPPADPITGHRIKADVIAWVERRRRLPDAAEGTAHSRAHNRMQRGVNFDAL